MSRICFAGRSLSGGVGGRKVSVQRCSGCGAVPLRPRRAREVRIHAFEDDGSGGNMSEEKETEKGIGDAAPAFWAALLAQALPFLPQSQISDTVYLLVVATATVYIGSARFPMERTIDDVNIELNMGQAILAPILLTCALVATFFVTSDVDYKWLLRLQITAFGGICLRDILDPVFYALMKGKTGEEKADVHPLLRPEALISAVVSVAIAGAYALRLEPSFLFNNLLAFGIASRNIKLFKPASFAVIVALLMGLVLYDAYWVFSTDVMVAVATGVDAPTEFLFPKTTRLSGEHVLSMLGFGDVVLPGMFTALMIFIDRELARREGGGKLSSPLNGPYFFSAMSAYVLSLGACFTANIWTQSAQPALLYIVPALVLSALGTAWRRGELPQLISFKKSGSSGP